MLVVSKAVREAYRKFLTRQGVVAAEQNICQKWLRYYLDFCIKYQHDASVPDSLGYFLIKLSEKKQSDIQKGQAKKAIQFYHKSFRQNSFPIKNSWDNRFKEKQLSNINEATPAPLSQKTGRTEGDSDPSKKNIQRSLSGSSWVKEFQGLEDAISIRHYSVKTLKSYRGYIRRFQAYTKSLDPQLLSAEHVKDFLTYLAVDKKVSASTQNLAFNSLLFFFRHVLSKEFGQIEGVVRAKKRPYIPVVLSRGEIDDIFNVIDPQYRLIIKLLYGCGLRLFECLDLRVQCLNFDMEILTIHDGKGQKDRTVPIPQILQTELKEHIRALQLLHSKDLEKGYGGVFLFNAIDRKYKNASREFIWQWLFPAKQLTKDKETKEMKRYHLHPTHIQKALRRAARDACLTKRVTAHTFRHSYASHLLQNNYDIRTIQELLGHSDVRTTMIYTHTVKSVTVKVAKSPLDF